MGRFFNGMIVGGGLAFIFNEELERFFTGAQVEFKRVESDKPEKPVAYSGVGDTEPKATHRHPATGVEAIDEARQDVINNATAEFPVELTWDEVAAMNVNYVKIGIGGRRYTVEALPS